MYLFVGSIITTEGWVRSREDFFCRLLEQPLRLPHGSMVVMEMEYDNGFLAS